MRKKAKVTLLALTLAACMACAACAPSGQVAEKDKAEADQPAVENEAEAKEGLSIAAGDFSGEGSLVESLAANIVANQATYAPEVKTLSDGTQVQRTPQDAGIYNVYNLNADNRGCAACHSDLNAVLRGLPDTVYSVFTASPHLNIDYTGKIDLGYDDCTGCHASALYPSHALWPGIAESIHGMHDFRNVEFAEQGGSCISCHVVSPEGDFRMWDLEKYSMLRGIASADASAGSFEFDHDTLSDTPNLNMSWVAADPEMWPITGLHVEDQVYGVEEDPTAFDSWEIVIEGDVANPMTITLGELIEKIPSVTDTIALMCNENPKIGGLIRNVEIKGIPLAEVVALAQPTTDTYYVSADDVPNDYSFSTIVTNEFLAEKDAWLVYEINGERLETRMGYPVMAAAQGFNAGACTKQVGKIRITEALEDEVSFTLNRAYEVAEPSQAVLNTLEGQIIEVGEPYTFEGFAYCESVPVAKVEFSLDMGATWTAFDTADGVVGPWTYWRYTWTPEAPGAYVLQVRATGENGITCATPAKVLVNAK